MRLRKLCDFVLLTKKNFLLNNIYASQIPGQSTCMESFIFASSYLCALTTIRIIHINNRIYYNYNINDCLSENFLDSCWPLLLSHPPHNSTAAAQPHSQPRLAMVEWDGTEAGDFNPETFNIRRLFPREE